MTQIDDIPKTMRAMVLMKHGDFDALVYHEDWPTPQPKDHEVLIRVKACGLNNTDVNTRTGWYSQKVTEATTGTSFNVSEDQDATWGGSSIQFPRIQGADAAGYVVALGQAVVQDYKHLLGQRVMVDTWIRNWDAVDKIDQYGYFGSECDGGFADYVAVDVRQAIPINSSLSDAEIATFATSYVTAENMLSKAQVKQGDLVLISGASGGVGSALIQLCHRRGAETIAMAGEAKHDQLRALHPKGLLPRTPENLAEAIHEITGRNQVDVVADVVGGDYWPQMIEALARGGRYTCSGAIAGPIVEFDLRTFYLRDLIFTGATAVHPKLFKNLVGYIERDEIKPMLANTYPLEELHDAQKEFIQKQHIGNIVVTM